MRCATIDIGSNSILLLIAESKTARAIEPLIEKVAITRLGEGLNQCGVLKEAALSRSLTLLEEYAETIRAHGVERKAAVATSAVRSAGNGEAFRAAASALLGVEVEIVSGAREAELSFQGACQGLSSLGKRRALIDIGGGSTEFVCGDAEQIESARSVEIGSVRLFERFIDQDPPSLASLAAMDSAIDEALAPLDGLLHGDLIGVAGTVVTLAMLELALPNFERERLHGLSLSLAEVEKWCRTLASLPDHARRQLPGMVAGRSDVLLCGARILHCAMRRNAQNSLRISVGGLRYGLAAELFREMRAAAAIDSPPAVS